MATVREIQVFGISIFNSLGKACQDYLKYREDGTNRAKMSFCIVLANGDVKYITIRQEDDRVVAYGDFEGLPNSLEWAQGKE